MTLYLDIGNTRIKGAYDNGPVSVSVPTNDLALKSVLRENKDKEIVVSSVVPVLLNVFREEDVPFTAIGSNSRHGLKLGKVKKPEGMGPDLICMLAAARKIFPGHNITVTSFGTATLVVGLKKDGTYIGGVFAGGQEYSSNFFRTLGMVKAIEFDMPKNPGFSTDVEESGRSGVYYQQIGGILLAREDLQKRSSERWDIHLATGGWAEKFAASRKGLFHKVVPELVLDGMRLIRQNEQAEKQKRISKEKE